MNKAALWGGRDFRTGHPKRKRTGLNREDRETVPKVGGGGTGLYKCLEASPSKHMW